MQMMDETMPDVHPNDYLQNSDDKAFGLKETFVFYWQPSLEMHLDAHGTDIAVLKLSIARAPMALHLDMRRCTNTTEYLPRLTGGMQRALRLEAEQGALQVSFLEWRYARLCSPGQAGQALAKVYAFSAVAMTLHLRPASSIV